MISEKLYSPKWTRWIVLALRFAVGAVFAFSGFVKAVDPWGVLYKFQDYVGALGLDWLSPFLLFGAFAISVVEFVLGVCLIVGAYRRVSVWTSFLLVLAMTPLTLWLAITNAVTDCGCFGEAIHLSNVATFLKNVVLLMALWYLLRFNVRVMNFYSPSIQWIVTLATIVFVTAVALYGYFYQPMIDFRPYKIGERLVAESVQEDSEEDNFVFIYEKDGAQHEFTLDNLPDDEDTTWVFVDRKQKVGAMAEIPQAGLVLTSDGHDVTSEVIATEGEQVVLVFSDMSEIDISYTYLINMIDDLAQKNNADVIGVAAASFEEVAEWNDMSMATYPIYGAADTELKMLARGNPAIVYLKDGVIVWKRTLQSMHSVRVEEALSGAGGLEWVAQDFDGASKMKTMAVTYVLFMILVLIFNRSYRVYKFSSRLIKKNQK